ncbi:MAG TPA: LptF/LptG family permease [Flavobacteriales bacterium]|nr:LptF/LptG family permease [Flavobacteriales bacterium]
MRRLHLMIIRAFVGPLLVTFVVVLFILVMQFLWKYVDDLMGKGLEWYVLLELMTYATASFVPLALPLAILLSSIMTLGGIGENSELVPMRSAGMSLLKILFPLVIFVCGLSLASYYFSNNVLPVANLRFHSLLWDVTRKKPALNLQPGIFYNGIDGFSIRAMQKDDDGTLHDVLIYDHRVPFQGNRTVVRARTGAMQRSVDGHFLVLDLRDGNFYREDTPAGERGKYPMMRGTFAQDEIRLDLSGLGLDRTDRDLFKDHYKMMTSRQLQHSEDSLRKQFAMRIEEQQKHLANSLYITRRQDTKAATPLPGDTRRFETALSVDERNNYFDVAMNLVRNNISFLDQTATERKGRTEQLSRFQLEWHRKRMLAAACLIFFFIGAPLGAIIRKGGMGLPVVFAIIFFLIFHIVSFSTEKLVISGAFKAWPGMWISSMVLLPIAVLLTWKASTDSPLFDADAYYRGWERVRSLFGRRHAHSSTV